MFACFAQYIFLMPKGLSRLKGKILKLLRCRVVQLSQAHLNSCSFDIYSMRVIWFASGYFKKIWNVDIEIGVRKTCNFILIYSFHNKFNVFKIIS